MDILQIFFFYKILAKYSPKRIKLHHFLEIFRGSMPPNPLANACLCHALHVPPLFKKYFEPPHPPKRNPRYATGAKES